MSDIIEEPIIDPVDDSVNEKVEGAPMPDVADEVPVVESPCEAIEEVESVLPVVEEVEEDEYFDYDRTPVFDSEFGSYAEAMPKHAEFFNNLKDLMVTHDPSSDHFNAGMCAHSLEYLIKAHIGPMGATALAAPEPVPAPRTPVHDTPTKRAPVQKTVLGYDAALEARLMGY